MSSTLRFKVGDLARLINASRNPEYTGTIVEIRRIGPSPTDNPNADYGIFISGFASSSPDGLWGCRDASLAPYPDPSEFDRDTEMWEDFKRLTGYQTPREVTCE